MTGVPMSLNVAKLTLLTSLSLITVVSFSEPVLLDTHHRCVHDEIAAKDLPMIRAEVGQGNTRGRHSRSTYTDSNARQNDEQKFTNVRITPVFIEPLYAAINQELISPNGPLMRAIEVMSSLLLVRPLMDNLTLTPSCRETHSSGANRGTCSELSSSTECGIFTVPEQVVGTVLQCDAPDDSDTCREEGPNGDGVATDFLVFVGTDSQQPDCGSGTFAFASSCAKDANHRPAVGYINLCAEQVVRSGELDADDTILYNILLHELIHALGFSRNRLSDFHDGNLHFYDALVTGMYNGNEITGIQSPKVLEVGRSYFGCTNLPYVPLENNGEDSVVNSHWEARVLHHESMIAFVPRDYSVLSNFTLAYFEDSGWYRVNYSSMGALPQLDLFWGKGLGCPFVLEPCSEKTYPYLCNTNRTYQCTFDLVSRGRCTDTNVYFDGCAVVIPRGVSSSCLHQQNTTDSNTAMEMYGQSSMCVDVGLTSSISSSMGAFPFCYGYQYFNNVSTEMPHDLQIAAYNETVWCNSSTVNRTAYRLHQRDQTLNVYCPQGNQLNVRLALARQTVYQVERKDPSNYEITLGGTENGSPTWLGILIAIIAVLVVIVVFGLPLLMIAFKAFDCNRQIECVSNPNVVSAHVHFSNPVASDLV